MSRTIHGKSHEALKAFRKKSAALTVYWIYVSRMNNEGVTWPSIARIAKDTGWGKDACHEARNHLVKIGALERVEDYIQPDWRKLKPQELARKRNFDKSEYYRPTGYVMHNGKRMPMLYNGADEASTLEDKFSDVLQNLTSENNGHQERADIKKRRIVLDSLSVLDSSIADAEAAGDGLEFKTPEQLFDEAVSKNKQTASIIPFVVEDDKPKARARRPYFDLIVELFGVDYTTLTATEKKGIGKVEAELKKTGRSLDDVRTIYKHCQKKFTDFTWHALTSHAAMALKGKSTSAPAPVHIDAAPEPAYEPTPADAAFMRAEREKMFGPSKGKVSA
jgi:hypothetical protein